MFDTTISASADEDLSTFNRLESKVRSYSRSFPTVFERAQGCWLHDRDGKRFLDFLSGCSSLNYGHNHPVLKEALAAYIREDGVAHSLDMHSSAKAAFLQALEEHILRPRKLNYRVQFTGPTGANAVEAALKLARKVTGRTNVIAFTNAFHGVTLGALAATGNGHHRGAAGAPLTSVTRMPFDGYFGFDVDTAAQLDQMLRDRSSGIEPPAAIILETVQGEGGLNVASHQWLRAIERIAKRSGALLIIDDIQAGCGRSGSFFSFEAAGLTPDIVTLAKSLSGMGLPMSAVLIKPEHDLWKPGEHNGTFRGNCHAFVTARAALETFWCDGAFEAEIAHKGERVAEQLRDIHAAYSDHVIAVKGRGMMLGLEMASGEIADGVVDAAFALGLLIETGGADGEVVKLLAPLTATLDELGNGLALLRKAIAAVAESTALATEETDTDQ
ncbi:MAG TPA: diaminobutyrate--2-oxoglutarate transaminase [Hyphomonadaceae bacterium]|nr:diaminobutyrate--2-oxoglutarate transaminase [Hyphomonadaceae bacterium]